MALKDVSVMIPQAVKRGSNALFTCNYDMENDTLYSVKWYKGKREFYRYTPKENPAMKVFAMTSGLNVEVSTTHNALYPHIPTSHIHIPSPITRTCYYSCV